MTAIKDHRQKLVKSVSRPGVKVKLEQFMEARFEFPVPLDQAELHNQAQAISCPLAVEVEKLNQQNPRGGVKETTIGELETQIKNLKEQLSAREKKVQELEVELEYTTKKTAVQQQRIDQKSGELKRVRMSDSRQRAKSDEIRRNCKQTILFHE